MSVQNLATVFGPNILRPKVEDPIAIMEGQWLQLFFYFCLKLVGSKIVDGMFNSHCFLKVFKEYLEYTQNTYFNAYFDRYSWYT